MNVEEEAKFDGITVAQPLRSCAQRPYPAFRVPILRYRSSGPTIWPCLSLVAFHPQSTLGGLHVHGVGKTRAAPSVPLISLRARLIPPPPSDSAPKDPTLDSITSRTLLLRQLSPILTGPDGPPARSDYEAVTPDLRMGPRMASGVPIPPRTATYTSGVAVAMRDACRINGVCAPCLLSLAPPAYPHIRRFPFTVRHAVGMLRVRFVARKPDPELDHPHLRLQHSHLLLHRGARGSIARVPGSTPPRPHAALTRALSSTTR
ncbi:hypothetical protein MVEN_01432400 [Mycena venus]|uniref:Uncharacterized protein n=1 Tax=Mycena venus TaxID=2733690 RepID=A0A8H6XWY9_9AGAR|nr:hypothetical protein MVEN_01432400 [Mycena venus]